MTQGYYDRDKTIAIVTSFYQFLVTLSSISPSDISYPPLGGWPDITPKSHAAFKKNEDVIDLYKYLPYLNKRHEISYLTYACDWRFESVKPRLEASDVVESAIGPLPDYVAVLTDGNTYGSYLLLDTQNGTITEFRKQERSGREQPPIDFPDHWKAYLTIPTSVFFESWKEKLQHFRRREVSVITRNEDDGLFIGWDDPLREKYLDRGRQAAKTKKPRFKALYDFTTQEENEISLKEEEVVSVIQKSDNGWSLAKIASGSVGWVPSAYLEEVKVQPPAPTAVIKPTLAPPPPPLAQNQENPEAQANEKERAKEVAEKEKRPTWLYDMMDQLFEFKSSKAKQDLLEMKALLANADAESLDDAEYHASYNAVEDYQRILPSGLSFEEWLKQWLKEKQDSSPSCSVKQTSASDIEKAKLTREDMLALERVLAEKEGDTPWEEMENSVMEAKAQREAEISEQILVAELEAAEEKINSTEQWEDEDWLLSSAWLERIECIETFGGEDREDIQIEMNEAKARRDAQLYEMAEQDFVAEMEKAEDEMCEMNM